MKRILIINTANTDFTGITNVILNYLTATHSCVQYEFLLTARVNEQVADILRQYGAVHKPPYSRSKKSLAYMNWLTHFLKTNHFDGVHVHGNSGTTYFDIHAAKKARIPIRICHCHSSSCKHPIVHYTLKPFLNRELTHAISCSDLAEKWLFTKKSILLPNGINIPKYQFNLEARASYRAELGLENNFVIGHIGYMDTEKNHMFLLSVFKKLLSVRPESKLVLIGDGRLRSEIEQYIETENLKDSVLVLGKRGDACSLYSAMDAFVLPSLFEGLPLSLVEAQTAGLPCFVSNAVTKQADLTGSVTYLGIAEEDKDSWVQVLTDAKSQEDRPRFASMVADTVFNIDVCSKTLLEIYGV